MSDEDSQVHHPPVRDAASLKNVLYGPGHEKFPSWPIAAAAEAPIATRAPPTGTSQRSKSWTDHTNYPKENVIAYTRPYMRRSHPHQLKTLQERCEKNAQEHIDYLTRMERIESKVEKDGNLPSPPVRDPSQHKNLQDYEKLLEDQSLLRYSYDMLSKENTSSLTQADLEEYTRTCEEINIQHQKQPSYAQSEGYHSYVSSSDSTSTPFLDRLRRDIDTNVLKSSSSSWDHDSIVTTSSGSASSSETLKWKGSLSDVSVASSSFNVSRQQLIAHSARVQTPQRHNSESVLYIENNRNDYPPNLVRSHYASSNCSGSQLAEPQSNNSLNDRNHSPPSPKRTVAERIHQYEKQATKYTYLDPDKKTKVSDPALKAIQKKALLLFYERHQHQNKGSWRSEPKLNVKPSQSYATEMALSCDNANSQNNMLKSKSQTDSESVNKSMRLPCALDYNLNQKQPSLTTESEQYKSYKYRIRETDNSGPQDKSVEPRISKQNNNTNYNGLPMYDIAKSVPEKPLNNYDEPVRRVLNHMKSNSREFKSHERSPSYDLSHYTPTKILPDLPLTTETQNADLQGPIIMGNSISVDDWVPERPPKNQELLRTVYPDLYKDKSRYHSPELPLPSPPPLPLCDEENVSINDEPFPPPPLEVIDEWKYQQEVLDVPTPRDLKQHNRHSTPESQKPGNYAVMDTTIEGLSNTSINNAIAKTPAPPIKSKPLKREYPSNSTVNIASRRNSFANAQDVSKDFPMLTSNMRSSVREKPNQFSSSKLVMSAQRQLYRSITVDQSPTIPKKPINPYLRSTSMRHDIEHKDVFSHNTINAEKSVIRPDRQNLPYHHHYGSKYANGLPLPSPEKKVSGNFRAEPMWIDPTKQDVKKNNDVNAAWRPLNETRRISLPNKPSEDRNVISMGRHDYQRKSSFDGSEINRNLYSFCETNIQNKTTRTADVRSTNMENLVKKPSVEWCKPTTPLKGIYQPENTRRQSATGGLLAENEKGSPDVNIGSYKKINVSIEKNYINSESRDVKRETKVPAIAYHNSPSKEVAKSEQQRNIIFTENKDNNNTEVVEKENVSIERKALHINEDNLPAILNTKDTCDKEVSIICDQKNISLISSEASLTDEEVISKSSPNCSKSIKLKERLKPRILLPEENVWEMLRAQLAVRLQPDTPLINLISQYDEYNNTIESITNIFELDVADEIETKEDSRVADSENEPSEDNHGLNEREKEAQKTIERLQSLKIDCINNKDDNSGEILKTNISNCLNSLVSALTEECIQLEEAASVNEAVGVQLLATASRSARLSRHATDVGSVTALISGLATRLATATRPLKLTCHTPEGRKMLIAKQQKLADQLEEAKKLKESIDARGFNLSETLSAQVSDEFKEQYTKFVATKVKLVVYLKDVQYRLDLAKQLLDSFLQENALFNSINNASASRTQV